MMCFWILTPGLPQKTVVEGDGKDILATKASTVAPGI